MLPHPALFAAIWLSRHSFDDPARAPQPAPTPTPTPKRRSPRAISRRRRRLPTDQWARVDLYAPAPAGEACLLDDTVAVPLDAPGRLEATIDTVARRLRALPEPHELGRRSIGYRSQLLRMLRQARHARARLDEGTYGTCLTCAAPIALSTLIEKPWTPTCARCAGAW